MEVFEHSLAKSFGEFPAYVNTSESPFVQVGRQFPDPNMSDLPTSYDMSSSFEQGSPKVHMPDQHLDFSAFMAEYSL